MGQYHKLINLDKKEVVEPHDIGLFSKQYEHTGVEGSLADAIYLLVMSSPASGGGDWPYVEEISGRWCGDRVVVLGDYTQPDAIRGYEGNANDLWRESESWLNISPDVRLAFEQVFPITYTLEEKVLGGEPYISVNRNVVGSW
jgi:hypothetical protein